MLLHSWQNLMPTNFGPSEDIIDYDVMATEWASSNKSCSLKNKQHTTQTSNDKYKVKQLYGINYYG